MMRFIKICGLGVLAGLLMARAADKPEPLQSLFVKNDAGLDKPANFVVIKDQKQFDKFFGHATVMWQKKKTPPPDFNKQLLVAAIHQGNFYTEYKVQAVTNVNSVMTIRYTTKARPTPSTSYACPMILALPREGFTAVQFIENDKPVATLKL
jgi:hypothetical protein